MRSIYILLTRSSTFVSRIIGCLSGEPYTHVSVAFDKELSVLYSFARRYELLPLPGGFVREYLDTGFYSHHPDIPCAVLELKTSDESYALAKQCVREMLSDAHLYKYSVLGLILCGLQKPLKRRYYYFCSEFVGELLASCGALHLPKPPSLMRPTDYDKLGTQLTCVYRGTLDALQDLAYIPQFSLPEIDL